MTLSVLAPAKINLTLDVTGRRPDGYHEIKSVMQAVDLGDRVTLTLNDSGRITLDVGGAAVPCDKKNTAFAAALAFFERIDRRDLGVHIELQKQVPMQAGMAGGSADAAGVLVGLNALTDAGLTTDELCAVGAKVGADVPFCVLGGTALATGTGTRLKPLPPMPDCYIVAAKPPVGVSTAVAYQAIDNAPMLYRPDTDGMKRALQQGRLDRIGKLLCNVFEQALDLPEVEELVAAMRAFAPLGCCMTGSGSVVFSLFADQAQAQECAAALQKTYKEVFVCHPFAAGAQVI